MIREKSGARNASTCSATSFFAGFFVMRVLFELAEQPALLKFQVETLQRLVDRFIGLDLNVNHGNISSGPKRIPP